MSKAAGDGAFSCHYTITSVDVQRLLALSHFVEGLHFALGLMGRPQHHMAKKRSSSKCPQWNRCLLGRGNLAIKAASSRTAGNDL